MKEIVKEYPITRVKCSNTLQLYRFPISVKALNILSLKQKPISKFVEINVDLPQRNVSALKMKTLEMNHLAFRAFPEPSPNLYLARLEDGKITVYEVQNIYLFQPFHYYCPFDYSFTKIRKAESREEFERRMKSINFRLKNVELEPFTEFTVEESEFVPRHCVPVKEAPAERAPVFDFKKLEEVIKRARIVNLKILLGMFANENVIKSVLYKMTDQIRGRFILKNQFYEKSLHDMRIAVIALFRDNAAVRARDLEFLGEERWLAEELADTNEGVYTLKGFKESVEFDESVIRMANLSSIKELLKAARILSSSQIAASLAIDEESVVTLIGDNREFFSLSNNAYALNDPDQNLNEMFRLLVESKSFDLSELTRKLESKGISFDIGTLVEDIRRYCTQRAGRFHLKSHKE